MTSKNIGKQLVVGKMIFHCKNFVQFFQKRKFQEKVILPGVVTEKSGGVKNKLLTKIASGKQELKDVFSARPHVSCVANMNFQLFPFCADYINLNKKIYIFVGFSISFFYKLRSNYYNCFVQDKCMVGKSACWSKTVSHLSMWFSAGFCFFFLHFF